jgi:hypothetical protein
VVQKAAMIYVAPLARLPEAHEQLMRCVPDVHLGCIQVCSVDCSPLEPAKAVSGATDRCIKVRILHCSFLQPVLGP